MKLFLFLAKQTVLLGTTGFAVWLFAYSVRSGHWFWASDTPQAWLFALLLVGCFVTLIAVPLQLLTNRCTKSLWAGLSVGAASGPMAVWLGLLWFTGYPLDLNSYVVRTASTHLIFAGLGLWFAANWRHRPRPNNSFKPKPLHGSACFRR